MCNFAQFDNQIKENNMDTKIRNTVNISTTVNIHDAAIVMKYMQANGLKVTFAGIASFAVGIAAELAKAKQGIHVTTKEAWEMMYEIMPPAAQKRNSMKRLVSSVADDDLEMALAMQQRGGGRPIETESVREYATQYASTWESEEYSGCEDNSNADNLDGVELPISAE